MKIGDEVSTDLGKGRIVRQADGGWWVNLEGDPPSRETYFVHTRVKATRPTVTTEELPGPTAEDRNNKLAGLTREEDD